jgi:UDP-2-acetamido-2-deoxy-ribo-hexuluronate aminotransferase
MAPSHPLEFIDLKSQYRRHQAAIDARIRAVLDHGAYVMGPEIAECEAELSRFLGVKHSITVANGTAALEIVLRALDIGPGHEVITVPFTWISTAEVVGLVGARPVFVDIEPDHYNIDPRRIEAAITPRTRAIIPVSLFGQMPDFSEINRIAERHGLTVIEDAAQSFGATQHGRPSGSVTRVATTSFFPAKPLGCYGDGGAIFTGDDLLADRIRAIRTHGGIQRHHHPLLGTNGRFDTLQAAVILAKLPHFPAEVEARRRIGARYSAALADWCVTPAIAPGNTHVYAQYTIRVQDRDGLGAELRKRGVPTAIYYPKCLHEQPVFADCGHQPGDFPEAMRAAREVISLPMHPFLEEAQQDQVIAAVREALSTGRV